MYNQRQSKVAANLDINTELVFLFHDNMLSMKTV